MRHFFSLSLVLLIFGIFSGTQAAGLLGVCLDNNSVPSECASNKLFFPKYAISNGKATVKYRVDRGTMGDFDESTLQSSVNEVLSRWENVSSLDFTLDGDGLIPVNVDTSNYNDYLFSDGPLGYSPIIFDDTGEILIDVMGEGAENDILGFATARYFNVRNNQILSINESQSLINGYLYKLSNRPGINTLTELLNEFKSTILHEFAHMVGLDHSQGAQIDEYERAARGEEVPELELDKFPIMFPISANPNLDLQRDDIASINIAYPKNSIANSTGSIRGSLLNGTVPIKSANIIAFNVNNPLVEMVTSVSDVDGLGQGNFVLPYLSPGSYIIKVEPISQEFTDGSSVGLHSPPENPSLIPSSFYNGSEFVIQNSSLDNALAQAFKIEVAAGENINSVNINLGEAPAAGFELSGRAINQITFLASRSATEANLRINKIGTGSRFISLSTDYSNLVSFSENPVRIRTNESTKVIKVRYRSLNKFTQSVGDEIAGTFSIPLRAEDLISGDKVDNKILRVF